MKDAAVITARMSTKKLKPASNLAEGLNHVIITMEIASAAIIPPIVELPEKILAAAGVVRN